MGKIILTFFLAAYCSNGFAEVKRFKRAHILILSATNDSNFEPGIDLAKQVLNQRGVKFKHVNLSLTPFSQIKSLNEFTAVVSTTDHLKTESFVEKLSGKERTLFNQFLATKKIRWVSLYSLPDPRNNYSVTISSISGQSKIESQLLWRQQSLYSDIYLPRQGSIALSNQSWVFPSKILENQGAKPILWYKQDSHSSEFPIGITLEKNGIESMHFFFAQSRWLLASQILSENWLQWVTKSQGISDRKVYLSAQVDDLFLKSELQNPEKEKDYRISAEELNWHSLWQSHFNKTQGNTNFRFEWAFNGGGSLGTDPLLKQAKSNQNDFFWVNHTHTHQNLNSVDYSKTSEEIKRNRDFFNRNFPQIDLANYSASAVVTPEISGIFNTAAMKAMKDLNVKWVTGDNSKPELRPPDNYAGHFINGLRIIPRHATDIFYNTSTVSELEKSYSDALEKRTGLKRDYTIEQILEKEANAALIHLISNDPAPYMFHQANARVFNYLGASESLMTLWIKAVVKKLRMYYSGPIQTYKFDDLAKIYEARQSQRDVDFIESSKVLPNEFIESYQACEQTKIDYRKAVLFLDVNASPQEVRTARDEACSKGLGFISLPENGYLVGQHFDRYRQLKDQFDKSNCGANYNTTCQNLSYQIQQTDKQFREVKQKFVPQFNSEYLKTKLEYLKGLGFTFQQIIVSGHSAGGYYDGEFGAIDKMDIASILTDLKINQFIKSIYLLGCYSATSSESLKLTQAFPNLQWIVGYGDVAPAGFRSVGLSFLKKSMALFPEILNQSKDIQSWSEFIRSRIAELKDLYFGFLVRPNLNSQKMFYYSRYSILPEPELYELDQKVFCNKPSVTESLSNLLTSYENFYSGSVSIPDNTDSSVLRRMYGFARIYDFCFPTVGQSIGKKFPKPLHFFKLLFYKNVLTNFYNYFQSTEIRIAKQTVQAQLQSNQISQPFKVKLARLQQYLLSFESLSRRNVIELTGLLYELEKEFQFRLGLTSSLDKHLLKLDCVLFSWHDHQLPHLVEAPHCNEDD